MSAPATASEAVLTVGEIDLADLRRLLGRFAIDLEWVEDGQPIPGSYWGEPEAGLRGRTVYLRRDTPVHSALHEACHTICMDPDRRAVLDTDAGGEESEENGVCYLQILLADHLPGVGADRLMADMDRWGYSFRLGSTRAWFEKDAEDAHAWLLSEGLIDAAGRPVFRCRG